MKLLKYILFTIIFIALLSPVLLYFYQFYGSLSSNYFAWSGFGSTLAPSISALAFFALITSIIKSHNEFIRQQEQTNIFKLIEFHNEIIKSIKISNYEGYGVFELFNSEIEFIYHEKYVQLARWSIQNRPHDTPEKGILLFCKMGDKNYPQLSPYSKFYDDRARTVVEGIFEKGGKMERDEILKNVLGFPFKGKVKEEMAYIGMEVFRGLSIENKVGEMMGAFDHLYDKYGQYFGRYFRNMHYTFEAIDNSSNKDWFRRVYRAQFSRLEISAILFNCVSSYSSEKYVNYVRKFKILDDIYMPGLPVNIRLSEIDSLLETIEGKYKKGERLRWNELYQEIEEGNLFD